MSGSGQISYPEVKPLFGKTPYDAANKSMYGILGPYASGIGRDTAKGLGGAAGTAMTNLGPAATALGSKISGLATSGYGAYQNSIDAFLAQLPGYNAAAQGVIGPGGTDAAATGYAGQVASQAFDPTQSNALYQNTATQALSAARTSEAARGMVDSGAAGAAEQQNILSPLANSFEQQRMQNEKDATALVSSTGAQHISNVGSAANIAAMGPGMQGQLYQAIPQLIQSLIQGLNLPAGAAQSILQMLTGAASPLTQLAGVTAPVVGQKSWGTTQGVSL